MKELKKIIYAEDETDIQSIVKAITESLSNYDMKICDNGKILLEEIDSFEPDLILLDVMMPEMDGPSTFKELKNKESTKNIPVIFMTAKAQVQEVKQYIEKGAIAVITKPFDPMTLCQEIQEHWEKYQSNVCI